MPQLGVRQFRDRVEAGSILGRRLAEAGFRDVLVVGLPRGGVQVAAEVARILGAPLDVVVVRKLGVPWQPELALGAAGEDGVRVLNPEIAQRVPAEDVEALTQQAFAEVARRVNAWRTPGGALQMRGHTVVLVDDGIATGATVRSAISVLRARRVARVVLAVPVVVRLVAEQLRPLVDDLVTLEEPAKLHAVGAWYVNFDQVNDGQVRQLLEHARRKPPPKTTEHCIPTSAATLPALVTVPEDASGLVLFAHGSGSSRFSPRNGAVAETLHRAGLGTVLMDLLTDGEAKDRSTVFDVALLAKRLLDATRWTSSLEGFESLPLGYFGASTGAAAALWAAADQPARLRAVVSRGGRPDLAGSRLSGVLAPTLLIVGGLDTQVLELNRAAQHRLGCTSRLEVVPGATHLFEEPGTLDTAARLATRWFTEHFRRQ